MFRGKFHAKQIMGFFCASDGCATATADCLLAGPCIDAILKMTSERYPFLRVKKLRVDADEAWANTVSFYKNPCVDTANTTLRVRLTGQAAIDTGGVWRQLYSVVFREFVENKHMTLFDGPMNSRRPVYSTEARASGIFTALGKMVAHSILQDGLGFPYLSKLCYRYITSGEDAAMQCV